MFAEAEADPDAPARRGPGFAFAVVNLHGVWGGDRAHEREQQMLHAVRPPESLRQRWADSEPVLVLGGT